MTHLAAQLAVTQLLGLEAYLQIVDRLAQGQVVSQRDEGVRAPARPAA